MNGVRLDNGEVWEWEQRGGWKRVIATPSVVKQLLGLFPQSQILESIFLGAAQTDQGSLLFPDPIVGRDGEKLFPLGWKERAMNVLVPTTVISPDDLEMRERRKLQKIKRSFLRDLRSGTPARREYILEMFHRLDENVDKHYLDYGGG